MSDLALEYKVVTISGLKFKMADGLPWWEENDLSAQLNAFAAERWRVISMIQSPALPSNFTVFLERGGQVEELG